MRDVLTKIAARLSPDTRRNIIVALGAAGLLLIFISGFVHTPEEPTEQAQPPPESQISQSDYQTELEQRLCSMISAIDGAGSVRVMITLDGTAEDVYVFDQSVGGSGDTQNEQREYVKVRSKDGSEQTVLRRQKMPEIRGVLVVCSGADSAVVREKITRAAAGALGIAQSKVVVTV